MTVHKLSNFVYTKISKISISNWSYHHHLHSTTTISVLQFQIENKKKQLRWPNILKLKFLYNYYIPQKAVLRCVYVLVVCFYFVSCLVPTNLLHWKSSIRRIATAAGQQSTVVSVCVCQSIMTWCDLIFYLFHSIDPIILLSLRQVLQVLLSSFLCPKGEKKKKREENSFLVIRLWDRFKPNFNGIINI